MNGWVGKESGATLSRKQRDSVLPGGTLMTMMPARTASPYVLRNQEMMNIKGTSQTQRMR